MRGSRTVLSIVIVVAATAFGVAAALAEDSGNAPAETYVEDWILVQLDAPLAPRREDGSFSLHTGFPGVDRLIEETGIWKIESALPVSTRSPRNPDLLRRHGLERVYRFHVPTGANIPALVERFGRAIGVSYAEPDHRGSLDERIPDDTLFPDQWGLHNTGGPHRTEDCDIDAPEAWDITVGEQIVIAVLDSGIDSDHEDLMNLSESEKIVAGYDFYNGDDDPEDDHGHGTRNACCASARTNNGLGVAGACWNCRLMPLKVSSNSGSFDYSDLADGYVWAADNGAKVINTSLSGQTGSQALMEAVSYASDSGAVLVCSTGNMGSDSPRIPAVLTETISVGATDDDDVWWSDSSYGPHIDLVAPGVAIQTCQMGGGYEYGNGTSYAAAMVSGVAGAMETLYPSVGREEVRHLLGSGAQDQVGDDTTPGFDDRFGWGRVNMDRTLQATEASMSLRVEGKTSTRVYFETANLLADSYDFVRGDLDSLAEDAVGVDAGGLLCLENDSPDPDTTGNEDTGTPSPGEAFFYVGRFNSAAGAGSYGGSSSNRDRIVFPVSTGPGWTGEGSMQNEQFGGRVGTAGDVNDDNFDDVIVGAPNYSGTLDSQGAAYVYLGSPAGLETSHVWMVEGDQAYSYYGSNISTAGDINGDGYDDIAVAAPRYANGQTDEGAVFVYLGTPSGPLTTPHAILEEDQAGAEFGTSVSAAGDVNGDGYDDIIVGARYYDNGETNEGRAFVYLGSASGLDTTAAWTAEPDQASASAYVGYAGDVNNDGYDDVVFGSPMYDGPDNNEGRAFVYHGSATGPSPTADTILEIDMENARFGTAVNTAGDVDGDGYDDLVVAAQYYTNGHTREGAAFLFRGSASGVLTSWSWSFESDCAYAQLGKKPTGTAGDVNHDGYDDVIVGSAHYHGSRGRVWVFLGSGAGLSDTPVWSPAERQAGAWYGLSCGAAGDVNGDGHDDVIVGARRFDGTEIDEGRAYVYHGPLSETEGTDCPR